MNNNKLNPERYLGYKSLVKYDKLSQFINLYYSDNGSNDIDLYIDISSFILSMSHKDNINNIDKTDDLYISAWIINMCAHYRRFFRTRYGVSTTIFLIYRDLFDNGATYRRVLSPEYARPIVENPNISNAINVNVSILKDIIKYIPDVEFICTKYEFGLKVMHIKKSRDNKIPAMVITNDIINYQLAAKNDTNNTCVVIPNKYNGDDISDFITEDNAIYKYLSHKKCNVTPCMIGDNHYYIPLIMAMSGFPKRNFKAVYSIQQTINSINELCSNSMIQKGIYTPIERVLYLISAIYPNKVPYNKQIMDRFYCLNFFSQCMAFPDDLDIDPYNGIVNLYNPQAVYEVNEKFFKNYQLDLNNL